MGGKKKTKWRKLPLAEFTKDCQSSQKIPSEEICQPDISRNERKETYLPSYETTENGVPNNYEASEYLDGFWLPTSCVVYNPPEVPVYPNYLIPAESFYYYYTMPEVPQMREYVSVPYQDYCPQPLKDTVYLLLPTQSARPTHGAPHVVSDWQNRRWRRRYEGYADYAYTNEKTNPVSYSREERDRGKKAQQYVSQRKYSNQSNYQKRINSVSESSSLNSESIALKNNDGESNEVKRLASPVEDCDGTENTILKSKKMEYVTDNSSQKTKKNLEMCAIHAKSPSRKTVPTSSDLDIQNENDDCLFTNNNDKIETELCSQTETNILPSGKLDLHIDLPNDISVANFHSTSFGDTPDIQKEFTESKGHINQTRFSISSVPTPEENVIRIEIKSTQNGGIPPLKDLEDSEDRDMQNTHISDTLNGNVSNTSNILSKHEKHNDSICRTHSQSSLPDILSTLNKSLLTNTRGTSNSPNIEKFRKSRVPDRSDNENEKSHISKSLLNQTTFHSSLLSSDNDLDSELKQLTCLQSLPANQSIYKLAYDDNVTDQSEADSRSPSPVDPESQVPSSLTNAEILIHEADSGSEAGSEDVELLPHRYESETFLSETKHVYVNKLSLAVELLRTQESLPYDEEFKRVVGENNPSNLDSQQDSGGKVNLGFVDDSPLHFSNGSDSSGYSNLETCKRVVKEHRKLNQKRCPTNEAMRDLVFEDLEESCELAKEVTVQLNDNQDNTEEVRAGYRRFGVQARHYFSPRAALVNPCFCCTIM